MIGGDILQEIPRNHLVPAVSYMVFLISGYFLYYIKNPITATITYFHVKYHKA